MIDIVEVFVKISRILDSRIEIFATFGIEILYSTSFSLNPCALVYFCILLSLVL